MNIKKILNNDLLMLLFSIVFGSLLILFADLIYKNIYQNKPQVEDSQSDQHKELIKKFETEPMFSQGYILDGKSFEVYVPRFWIHQYFSEPDLMTESSIFFLAKRLVDDDESSFPEMSISSYIVEKNFDLEKESSSIFRQIEEKSSLRFVSSRSTAKNEKNFYEALFSDRKSGRYYYYTFYKSYNIIIVFLLNYSRKYKKDNRVFYSEYQSMYNSFVFKVEI